MTQEPMVDAPDFSTAIENVSNSEKENKKELALCAVCLQWTTDGHDCYRPGICPEEEDS